MRQPLVQFDLAAPTNLAFPIDAQVDRNPIKPGVKAGGPLKRSKVPMSLEEGLLRDIACLVGILEQSERQRKDTSLIALYQDPEGPLIATSTTLDQLGLGATLFFGRRIAGSPTWCSIRQRIGLAHRCLASQGRQWDDLC